MWLTLNFLLTLLLVSHARGKYTKITSKPDNVIFKYRQDVNGEKKLRECGQHEACNVVHERFWLPFLVERICRCPNGFECPWSGESTDHSMMLDNRSLLKFCESVKSKKTCTRKQSAAIIHGQIEKNQSVVIPHDIRINCKCPRSYYWKLQKYTFGDDNSLFQVFRCLKQTMCDSLDFCGLIRADLYSVYYRCTCPNGHLCISKDRQQEDVQELLYTGPAYRAYCLR